jgi:hypothetical protein
MCGNFDSTVSEGNKRKGRIQQPHTLMRWPSMKRETPLVFGPHVFAHQRTAQHEHRQVTDEHNESQDSA